MKKLNLDKTKSKEVYDYFKDNIKIKECYNNTFNLFTLCPKTFREGKWKVAYGYVEVMPLLCCRHCFVVDENDKVIDPTIYVQDKPNDDRKYFVMYVFDDTDEYLNAIESDNLMPALDKYLREQDKQAQQWANENGYLFIG